MLNIRSCLVCTQWGQVKARRDALIQLTQLRARQHRRKLRLTGQNNLQKLFFICFEVGEQSNLFKDREVEMLRLVNHQHSSSIGLMIAQQKLMQCVSQYLQAICALRVIDVELVADRRQ